jgi:hypothetical protein
MHSQPIKHRAPCRTSSEVADQGARGGEHPGKHYKLFISRGERVSRNHAIVPASPRDCQGIAVASIIPFIRKTGVAFDDRVTSLLGQAFDAACRELHDKGQPHIVYEIIAGRIIEAARKGERDVSRLAAAGLSALGIREDHSGLKRSQ